ncbi:hypothetical protein SDC9_131183 [bioreactor metagenome]|uniref:Uncharacterized protein n=1 Tax=bioreactor metagenome TaxID=1076179 RepID=A0A645D639_9ZZZZ
MPDFRSGPRHRHRADAGIGEQIQRFDLRSERRNHLLEELPVAILFGKKPKVAEAGRFDLEIESGPADAPAFGQGSLSVPPGAMARAVAHEFRIGNPPFALLQRRPPAGIQRLPDQTVWANLLKFAEAAAVQQSVFGEVGTHRGSSGMDGI